jgi:hypothetical protein
LLTAAVIAMLRTRNDGTVEARMYRGLLIVQVPAYPLLGLAYVTDRLGTVVEAVFFLVFSTMLLTEVFEPMRRCPTVEVQDRVRS